MESSLVNGVAIGVVPTASMLLCSLMAFNFKPSATFESTAQNFCAGLILGAVARELFPEISKENSAANIIGITIGTAVALILVNFIDYIVMTVQERFVSAFYACETAIHVASEQIPLRTPPKSPLTPVEMSTVEDGGEEGVAGTEDGSTICGTEVDQNVILLSSQAFASPKHRVHVRAHVTEMLYLIESMQNKADQLVPSGYRRARSNSNGERTLALNTLANSVSYYNTTHSYQSLEAKDDVLDRTRGSEYLADEIDSDIHRLQYTVDHCRRLLQGSGAAFEGVIPRTRVTQGSKLRLKEKLDFLQTSTLQVQDTLLRETITPADLHDLHEILDAVDEEIGNMHTTVEAYSFKWGGTRRSRKEAIDIEEAGSFVPLSLVSSVVVDCIVDGFLMGSTAAVSLRAGSILAFANSLEMGFLGIAVSMRIQKCTASYASTRYAALILPPLVMLGAAVLGLYTAQSAQQQPLIYVSFISFGIVALVHLVVNELLSEARESIKGREQWWTAMVLFAGIYVVLILDLILPI